MRYFFHIAYDGTEFRGWQRQAGVEVVTVQETIEIQFRKLFQKYIPALGCGRTDARVHANQYFFHVEMDQLPEYNLVERLNYMLPSSISVFEMIPVKVNEHARYSASERIYDYYFHTQRNPFLDRFSSYYPLLQFDTERVKTAINYIVEQKDFRAFCKSPDKHDSTKCEMYHIRFFSNSAQNQFRVQFSANRYLRSMIRLIMQAIIDIGTNKYSIDELINRFDKNDPPGEFLKAHPQGLFLSKVNYPFLEREMNVVFENGNEWVEQ